MKIEGCDFKFSVDTLGDACHFGVAVPVKFEATGDEHEEKREFGLYFDGQSNDGVRFSELINHVMQFWYFDLVHFLDQKLVVLRIEEGGTFEVLIFTYDASDEAEQVLEGVALRKDALQKMNLLRFVQHLNYLSIITKD